MKRLSILALALLLAGCGGSSGSKQDGAPPATDTQGEAK